MGEGVNNNNKKKTSALTDKHVDIDRYSNSQIDRQIYRQKRHIDGWVMYRQINRKIDIQIDRQMNKQIDRYMKKQIGKWTQI